MIPEHWPKRPEFSAGSCSKVVGYVYHCGGVATVHDDGSIGRIMSSSDLNAMIDRHNLAADEWAAECFRLAMQSGDLDLSHIELRELLGGRVEFTVRTVIDPDPDQM